MSMKTTASTLLASLAVAIATSPVVADAPPMVVTDLRVVVADSEQTALRACHAMNGSYVSVGVDWTMGGAQTPRFVQLCKQRQRLEDSYTGDVVQRVRVVESTCPPSRSQSSTWVTLHTPRVGVVVCMLKTPAQRARQLHEFLLDIDVTRTQFYNDALPEWTTLRDTSIHEWRNSLQFKDTTGVFMSVRRPLSSLVSLSILPLNSTAYRDASASACGDAEDIGWITDFNGSRGVVICATRKAIAGGGNESVIVDVEVAGRDEDCDDEDEATETTKTELTRDVALCVTTAPLVANASYVSELRVERWSTEERSTVSNPTYATDRFVTAVEKSGFELVETLETLKPDESRPSMAFLFLRRAFPVQDLTVETHTEASNAEVKPPLKARVHNDGLVFKVLQLADLHYSGNASTACLNAPAQGCTEATTTTFVADLLDLEKPDFVVLSGDNVQTHNASFRQAAVDAALSQVEQRSIPYALIFGNHDDENGFSLQELIEKSMEKPHSYTERGPMRVDGVGNYQLPVQAPVGGVWSSTGSSVFRMYFLDSHAYPDKHEYPMVESRYDWIKPSQIQLFQQLTNSTTRVPAALMFFHIPLPEYAAAPINDESLVKGDCREVVSSSDINSHLFSALVDQQEVKATFSGHDHVNDYCYKREGIQLCYGGGTGFGQAYGASGVARRARVIEWSVDALNQRRIYTWTRLHDSMAVKHAVELLYSEAAMSTEELAVLTAMSQEDPELTSVAVLYCGLVVVLAMAMGMSAWGCTSRNDRYHPVDDTPTRSKEAIQQGGEELPESSISIET